MEKAPDEDIGLFSLRLSLIAFVSTYEAIGRDLGKPRREKSETEHYRREYFQQYITAILYAHHFAELALKKLLRNKGALLPLRSEFDACHLDDLSNGIGLDCTKIAQINTVEFAQALQRIRDLVKERRLVDSISNNVVNSYGDTLKELNTLRNRLWHRGTFVLHYDALDCLFGRYLLPLMRELAQLYTDGAVSYWRHPTLYCGIDPLDGIERVYSNCERSRSDSQLVAIYKELARAAYRNPLAPESRAFSKESLVNRAIHANNNLLVRPARAECEFHQPEAVKQCPVCGEETLMVFSAERDGPDDTFLVFTSEIRCALCSLALDCQVISEDMQEPKAILDLFR